MAFVNVSLLLGGLLTAIPVILHLVLRQQPRRVSFPALRFLKERQESNRRQLQLRQWLLLFLRCAVIALLALALARPSVARAAVGNWSILGLLVALCGGVIWMALVAAVRHRGRWLVAGLGTLAACLAVLALIWLGTIWQGKTPAVLGDQEAPVAAVLVFDTSPRMDYRFHNQTRLVAAKETGLWLLSQFPIESSVAVMESRSGPGFFSVDLAAAKSAVERLRPTGAPEPLTRSLDRAVQLLKTSDKTRREIYVLTDLAAAAWPADRVAALKATLEESPDVLLYVIDIGVDQPRNLSLGPLQLSAESLVSSGELVVTTDVQSLNASGEYTVELLVEQPDPTKPIVVDGETQLPAAHVRDRKTIQLAADASQQVEFRLRGWERGTQQGQVRVIAEDGLASDNVRYFAIDVRDAWPVLVVSPANVSPFLLTEALAPFEQRETGSARFDCRAIAQADLQNQDLASFAVVCLVNPEPLTPDGWEQLGRFVERGGSLVLFLGHNAQPVKSFNEPAAQRLLGAKLTRQYRAAGRDVFLSPRRFEHPALAIFREQASSIPWDASPVLRHWSVDELTADTSVVVEYSNAKPAILERPLGRGRIVITTTPFVEPSRPEGRTAWNELLTSEYAWPNFVLLNELVLYLAGGGEARLNYSTGETATLANDPEQDPPRYQLFTPLDEPQEIVPRDGSVTIAFTEQAGAYRLKGQRQTPTVRGFAVNLPMESTDLRRTTLENLRQTLGDDLFRYARNRDEIVMEVGEARVGREFYPYLLLVLVIVLGLEHTLANRFYRPVEPQAVEQP